MVQASSLMALNICYRGKNNMSALLFGMKCCKISSTRQSLVCTSRCDIRSIYIRCTQGSRIIRTSLLTATPATIQGCSSPTAAAQLVSATTSWYSSLDT